MNTTRDSHTISISRNNKTLTITGDTTRGTPAGVAHAALTRTLNPFKTTPGGVIAPDTPRNRRAAARVISGLRHNIRINTPHPGEVEHVLGYAGVATHTPGHSSFQVHPLTPGGFPPATVDVLNTVGAYPRDDGSRSISLNSLFEFLNLNHAAGTPIVLAEDTLGLITHPLTGYAGGLLDLQDYTVRELSFVRNDVQPAHARRKTKKTLPEKLEKHGFTSLYELLMNRPRHYIDKSNPQNLGSLTLGEEATIIGTIDYARDLSNNMGVLFRVRLEGGGTLSVSFFRQPWLKKKYPPGVEVLITGVVQDYKGRFTMTGKTIESLTIGRDVPVVPIYNQSPSQGITTRMVSNMVRELLTRLDYNTGVLTPPWAAAEGILTFQEALEAVHYPASTGAAYRGIESLAYYEMLLTQILLKDAQQDARTRQGVPNTGEEMPRLVQSVIESLPYQLTGDQGKVLQKTLGLMSSPEPFTGLLSADVGAGKTIIQFLGALQAVASGRQAVIVAPTEILARQLYTNLQNTLQDAGVSEYVSAGLLVAGLKAAEKRALHKSIQTGSTSIVVGTHAALSKTTRFHDLGFVCFDEQQKFGAEQRTLLLNTREDGRTPDFMMATATPIPRSVAQVMFGDVELLEIHEKPAGRKPIRTTWHQEHPTVMLGDYYHTMWEDVRAELDLGRQAFIITPLVEDTSKIDAASVTSTHKELTSGVFKGYRVGFAHGKMKREDQQKVMRAFRDGEYDVLVASTVVEVGVDIPNATRMVVLSADRLGASTLHQIRGRVGRNAYDCACYLVSNSTSESTHRRLESLVNSQDGFRIAQEDLMNRGEGDVLSAAQAGGSASRFATIRAHSHLLGRVSEHADRVLGSRYRGEAIMMGRRMFGDVEFLK